MQLLFVLQLLLHIKNLSNLLFLILPHLPHSTVILESIKYDFPSSKFGVYSVDVRCFVIDSFVNGSYSLINFPLRSSIFACEVKFVDIPLTFDALILNENSEELSKTFLASINSTA